MRNALIIICLILLIIFFIPKKKTDVQNTDKTSQTYKSEKLNLDNINFGKYPVPVEKSSVEHTQKSNNSFEKIFNNKSAAPITENTFSKQITSAKNIKKIAGEPIPDWVYENTSSSDRYSNLILSGSNSIFFSYADCPIGKSRKSMVRKAIMQADAYDKFSNKSELVSVGSSYMATCNKTYKNGKCYYNAKNINEGTCKCAPHYFLDNCMDKICIINPKQRRIVIVPANEEILTEKLKELKEQW